MTYACKREKVFALQDPKYPDCTPPRIKRSDHRLKAYPSTYDDRSWELSDERRYRALYELVSGSQTCLIGAGACHKYVPLEDLIRILMSEKDELIKKLEEELRRCCKGQGGDNLGGDQGTGQADKIAALTDELNNSREMLRKAMHKLQNIDEIVNENKTLQCRLRCSEERIKYLEEKKKSLESELEDLRSKSQIQIDLEQAREMLQEVSQRRVPCGKQVDTLTSERDKLQEKVKQLEKELEESKKKEAEIQRLRKNSKEVQDKEEITVENECFKKKLASMRCLEKQIQELKKHGRALADKYKREAQKAAEQMNRMCQAAKELQALREERDSLRNRVKELSSYEGQYNALQRKLRCVEEVIAENEFLNSKMVALEKLEKENEYLKCRLNRIQEMENTAAEDKERILQLQCAVADQEEEMKELLSQIERLTSGTHQEELERLRCELYEKNSKLKLCEEQLAEIPMLEAEIDELRTKLQICCREFPEKKMGKSSYQKIEVRLPAATTGICAKYKLQDQKYSSLIKRKCEEKLGTREQDDCKNILEKQQVERSDPCKSDTMTCEEVQNLLQSSKGIISCVLEDMVEHQKEMEELEKRNKALKGEIEMLKAKIGTDVAGSQDVNDLKKALEEANKEISRLKVGGSSEEDVELLKDLNSQMKAELQAACEGLKKVSLLEEKLEEEHRARCKAERQLKEGKEGKAGVLEPEDANFDCCQALQRETDDLKLQILELNKLTDELKKENNLLRELQKPCPDFSKELDEKCALENLLSLLQSELDAFKGQKLSDECEALRNELKRVLEQNCQLKALIDCYRQRLDLEKKSKVLDGGMLAISEGKQPIGAFEKSKSPSMTPSGRIIPSPGASERSKTPTMTPSGHIIPTPEALEKSKSPTITPSGHIIPTPEALEKSKSPTITPSGRIVPSPAAQEGSKPPMSTPSGRIVPSPEEPEGRKPPTITPSGRVVPSPEVQEGRKPPTITPSGRVVPSPEVQEGRKPPTITPSGRVVPSPEVQEGRKSPTITPSGRVVPSPEEPEGRKPPTITPSGRVVPSPEVQEGRKPSTVTPSGHIIPSPEALEKSKSPTITPSGRRVPSPTVPEGSKPPTSTPSGRIVPSPTAPEGTKPPTSTPSGRIVPSPAAQEGSKPPTSTPSGRIVPSPEAPEGRKPPTSTPSGRIVPSPAAQEGSKPPTLTPSGRIVPSPTAPEASKPPTSIPGERIISTPTAPEGSKPPTSTPSGRIAPSPAAQEGSKPPTSIPGERVISTPAAQEGGKQPTATPGERIVPSSAAPEGSKPPTSIADERIISTPAAQEGSKQPTATPGERIISTPAAQEGGKQPMLTPSGRLKSTAELSEKGSAPTKTPSGRVAFTPDTVEKGKEKLPPADVGKQDQDEKSGRAPPSKDEKEEPKVSKTAPTLTSSEKEKAKQEEARVAREEPKGTKELKVGKDEPKGAEDKSADNELARLRERLKQMEAENAEKIKALIEQHKKELANRDKAYNDNLNAMKAGYETDIRKLADRHKQSVLKLQGLHEDEVNELNTNYETQMEMMQTQSEAAINDVAKGSAAKLKKLVDQHAKEMEGKDNELKKLQEGLSKSQRELQTLRNKLESPDSVDALQAKHSREMNAMKRGSQRKLSLLKEKFEKERRKSEIEVENLKKKIKGAVCDCKFRKKDRKLKDPCAPLDFIEVVEKILERGLEALSFNEIALVHRKACCALEEMIMNSNVIPTLEPPVGECCPHLPFIEADREQLLRKIFTLQNDIQEKQRQTQETIINMELSIKRERCRLLQLKNLLIDEQRKNSELKMVIQSQSQIQTNLKKERDELGNKASLHESLFVEKSKQLDQEKEEKKSLEEEVERLRMKVKQLCFALEMLKEGPECQQNDQIEMLHVRLEQAQNQERKLAFQLQEEAKHRLQLQCQVQALRQSFKQMVNLPAVESQIRVPQNPLDAKSAKEMKNLDQLKEKKNKSKPPKKHKK